MKNKKNLEFSTTTNRAWKMPMIVVALLLMFGLAVAVNAATITRQLDLGSRGQDVTDLQIYLASDANIYPSGLVTGYFGQLTKAGVERFQTNNGIVSSGTPATTGYGRVGPVTMAALNQKMNGFTANATAPSIQLLNVSTSNTTASLNWNTNENSSAIVYYSTSPIQMTEASATTGVYVSGSSMLVGTNLQSTHSTTITGLMPNTNYNYVVYARDGLGNESITWPAVFRTQ